MLMKSAPGLPRHLAAVCVAALAAAGGDAALAEQPAAAANRAPILVSINVKVSDPRTNETQAAATQYVVRSGELPVGMLDSQPLAFACTPYLPGDPTGGERWSRVSDAANKILIECELWDGGTKAFTPSMVALDGRPVVVKHVGRFPGDTESRQYEMEVTATTSEAAITAAGAAGARRD